MKPRHFYQDYHIEIKQPSETEMLTSGLICQYLGKIFPTREAVSALVSQPNFYRGDKPNDVYTEEYLPFHLHDLPWLTAYTIQVIENAQSKHKLKAKYVEKFIESSTAFDSIRSYYENDLVKANIKQLLKHKSPVGVQDYDLVFRQELLKMMQPLDLDEKSLEVYIEQNANIWRKPVMLQAFENKYSHFQNLKMNDFWKHYFVSFKKAHQELWLKNREYRYGEDHLEAVTKAGTLTKNMQITDCKIKQIQEKLCKFENKLNTLSIKFKKSIMVFDAQTPLKQKTAREYNPNGVMLKTISDNDKTL